MPRADGVTRRGSASAVNSDTGLGCECLSCKDRTASQSLHKNHCRWIDFSGLAQSIVGQKAHLTFMRHLRSFYVLLWPEFHVLAVTRQLIYNVDGAESQQLLHE